MKRKKRNAIAAAVLLLAMGTMPLHGIEMMAVASVGESAASESAVLESAPALSTADNGDGTYTVTVSLDGSIRSFDYGVVYDDARVTVEAVRWVSAFLKKYDNGVSICMAYDHGTYVAFGGARSAAFDYTGGIAEIILKEKKTGDPGQVAIVADSGKFKKRHGVALDIATAVSLGGAAARNLVQGAEPVETAMPWPTESPVPDTTGTPTPSPVKTSMPGTSETPGPDTSETPEPETSETPIPGTSETPTPAATNTPEPGPTGTPPPVFERAKGDVNGDGRISLADAQITLWASLNIVTLAGGELWAADVNGDNRITLGNAQVVLKAALGISDMPPHQA